MSKVFSVEEFESVLNIDNPNDLCEGERELYDLWNASDFEDNIEVVDEIDDEIVVEGDSAVQNEGYNSVEHEENSAEQHESFFRSKSGMEWSKKPYRRGRRGAHNILTVAPGLTNNSENIASVEDPFKLFLSESIMNIICEWTNVKGREVVEEYNQKCDPEEQNMRTWKDTNNEEMYAFIAILIAAGKIHSNQSSISELWSTYPAFRNQFFTAVMARARFQELSSAIRFDDKRTRQARIQTTNDKLAAIRDVFDLFVKACIESYSPDAHITVDERLATFRGKCPFRVYMKSKPGKYGIKIWVCADAKNGYVCNLQVYTGMMNNQREINQGMRVVKELVSPYFGSGRGVTTDNFFTSIPLAEELMTKQLSLIGTLRANKREVPSEFLPKKSRAEKSSIFGFTETLTMVSYVPKKNKAVILLSTQHNSIEVEDNEEKKPIIISDYNQTKGGVDLGDMMTAEYSCVRITNRWPYRLFMELIDIAALNAHILWTTKNPEWKKNDCRRRRHFLLELALNLAKPYCENRAKNSSSLQKDVICAMETIGVIPISTKERPITPGPSKMNASKRCALCPRNEDRKTRIMCCNCQKPVCNLHRRDLTLVNCLDCQ